MFKKIGHFGADGVSEVFFFCPASVSDLHHDIKFWKQL